MKKIVLAIFTLQGGGAERFVLTLAKAFFELGFEVHVVSFKEVVDYPLNDNIYYHTLDYQKYRWLPKVIRLPVFAKIFDNFVKSKIGEADMILSNLYPVDCVLHHSKLPNIAYVIHNTLSVEYELNQQSDKINHLKNLYSNKLVICVSHGVKKDFLEVLGNHSNIIAIHNPIDQEDIIKQTQSNITLPAHCENGYLIHVGKFKPQKNHQLLIRAYHQSSQKLPLLLLGTGGEMQKCELLVKELGLDNKIHFMRFCQNPYPYIAQATGMVLSSDFEGFGIVVAEALSLQVPVISTDCPHGPAELLNQNCLVPVQDVQGLADKMSQLMDRPTDFKTAFSTHLLPHCVGKEYLRFMGID